VLANTFEWRDGRVSGVKPHALARDNGKSEALEQLGLPRPVVMVGDAWSDCETRTAGAADAFVAFVENTERPGITAAADMVVHSLGELVDQLEHQNKAILS
jgi:phosphoglycolate phosphatase-like HAD superfamily hydrolase